MEYKKKTIYCPICKRKVAEHDGRGTTKIDAKCGKCNKLIVYKPTTQEILVRPIPLRAFSSGKRFY